GRAQRAGGDSDGSGRQSLRRSSVTQEDAGGGRLERRGTIIGGVEADLIDFGLDRSVLGVKSRELTASIGAVGGLGGQRRSPVEQIGHLGQRAIGGLGQADALIGVSRRLIQGGDVRLESIGDFQARWV